MQRLSDLHLAQRAALAGAVLGMDYFRRVKELPIDLKADGSIVTEADLRVEQLVRSVLLAERPDDACLGEETGQQGTGRRRWILDGIDGTAVFVQAQPSRQTLIALEEDGLITVAIASVPAHGKIWWAERGGGTHVGTIQGQDLVHPRRHQVGAAPTSVEASQLGIVPDYDSLSPTYRAVVDNLVAQARLTKWDVPASLLLASGELDIVVQLAGKVWDFAAPSLIVEEAGGVFSGTDGQAHPVFGNAVYSRNAHLHSAALALLA
ncbi:MAG: inositol monophosphatase family protein [Chloroflexota bacterium]